MAKPQTIVRDGSGTRTVSYVLPPGVFQYIESILVEVDNGAAVDVNPELSIATVNGQVMADKRQSRAIPAGDTGRATWALRLDDETDIANEPFLPVLAAYAVMTGGQVIANNTLAAINFTSVKYDHGDWIDLGVNATLFTVPTTGYYTVWAQFEWNIAGAAGQRRSASINLLGDPFAVGLIARLEIPTINAVPTSQQVTLSRRLVAGSTMQAIAFQNSGGNFTLGSVHFAVTRVWKG